MLGWLRRLGRGKAPAGPDAARELEIERCLAEAGRDLDRFKDKVLDDQHHYVTRQGGGGLPPPRGE